MIVSEQIIGAFRNLMHHKMRAFLTMLGMVFGVGAVIAMIAISEGARAEVLLSISDMGVDRILLKSVKPINDKDMAKDSNVARFGLTYRDRDRILSSTSGLLDAVTTRESHTKLQLGSEQVDARVLSTEPSFLATSHLHIVTGRFLCPLDMESRAPVAVIGKEIARKAYRFDEPLGQYITVHRCAFKVVGVVSALVSSGTGGITADEINHSIFLPEPSAHSYLGLLDIQNSGGTWSMSHVEISQLIIHLSTQTDVLVSAKLLRRIITQLHPHGDVEVVVPLELLEQKRRTQRTFTIIMSSIASISLLVGGIGITNIMLASVLERTREIGIRRAVGARRRDILWQFLMETVLMSVLGGIVGIMIGIIVAYLVNHFAAWPIQVTAWSIGLSIGISVLVGLAAGVSPAITAARLQPVQALRHA
jgi:putative ABC transport system permease protein